MADAKTGQTPEGRMIEEAAKADGRSVRRLAANAGMSDTRWRHIVKGWQPGHGGQQIPVRAPAMPLARMAHTLGLTAANLREVDREDAATILDKFANVSPGDTVTLMDGDQTVTFYVNKDGKLSPPQVKVRAGVAEGHAASFDAQVAIGLPALTASVEGRDEIDLIYASRTMSPREKLLRIRQVLELRAQAEAEEAGQYKAAPALDAETADNGESEPENQPS